MSSRITTYKEFYVFYLSEHTNKTSRFLHFIGTSIVVLLLFMGIYQQNTTLFWLMPLAGYSFAWVGHFFFEKNKPATFKYPFWSLASDFKMCFDLLRGNIKFDTSTDNKY